MAQDDLRPIVTCLMECSIDGRLDESRWSTMFDKDGEGDPDVYYETRNKIDADAALLGRVTVQRHYARNIFKTDSHSMPLDLTPFRGIRTTQKMLAVFDSTGMLSYDTNVISGSTVIAVLGSKLVSEEYLCFLREKEVSYTFAGDDGRDLKAALSSLYNDFGLKHVLLAGGGLLNGSFLKAGLIDELDVVIYPGLDGLNGVNSIFEYKGDKNEKPCLGQSLELLDVQKCRAGVVLLKYAFHRDSD